VALTEQQEKAQQHILSLRSQYRLAKECGDKTAQQRALAEVTKAQQDYRETYPLT
jgi:hypothetical protein